MDTSKLETQPIHEEKQTDINKKQTEEHSNNEENVVTPKKTAENIKGQKSQPMNTLKLETQPIHKEKQTDSNKEQTKGKSEFQVQST